MIMAKTKENENNKKKKLVVKIVVYCLLIFGLGLSLIWSNDLEIFFKLKPDTSPLEVADDFQVHFIDVGQGDAIAMRFSNGETMLVDSGPVKGESNLKSYLNNVFFKDSEKVFDYVLLTHSDADHCGNMTFVLHNYTVKTFYRPYIFNENEGSTEGLSLPTSKIELYTNVINTLKSNNIKTDFFKAGTQLDFGNGIVIDFYAPVNLSTTKTNDFSPIMVVTDNGKLVCLTGDASSDEETEAMTAYTLPDVDLLKLGHHGSKYSTSLAFLEQIQPEYIVAQVGKNTYGHPSGDVLDRMEEYDSLYGKTTRSGFLNNLDNGNIIYHVVDGDDFKVVLISSMSNFVFMDWYMVVLIVGSIITVIIFFPKTKKYTKKKYKNKNTK